MLRLAISSYSPPYRSAREYRIWAKLGPVWRAALLAAKRRSVHADYKQKIDLLIKVVPHVCVIAKLGLAK